MSSPITVEQQLRDWVGQLAPEHKQILLLMLASDDKLLQATRLEFAEAQLRQMATARHLKWEELGEEERESFLAEVIRDEEMYTTQIGSGIKQTRVSCYHCGHEITPSDLYRIYFGDRFPKLEPTSAKLMVLDMEGGNIQFPVATEGETLIGRFDPHRGIRPTIDLSKYDPASRVSRRHARITIKAGQYFVEDLGSANGTVVNGRTRLKPQQPVALTNGDLVKIGETTLKFVS